MINKKILLDRVFHIRKPILGFLLSSAIDIGLIAVISSLYERIVNASGPYLITLAIFGVSIITLRTIAVFFLRKYSYREIMLKKNHDEYELVRVFISNRDQTLPESENSLIAQFKESIINSTQLATVNFDLPVASLIGELLFAFGGIVVLIYNVGFVLILSSIPVLIILLLLMRKVADSLHFFGSEVLSITEKRLGSIDNIAEASLELCVGRASNAAAKYFNESNIQLNSLISRQLSLSNSIQLVVESASFIIILLSLILISQHATSLTMGGAAASLAVLARMVPTITRSIASITQLHYGIPAVLKLHGLREYIGTLQGSRLKSDN